MQHYFPKKKIIELIYGDISYKALSKLIAALLSNEENAVIISSDLSHYYDLHTARERDRHCLVGVRDLSLEKLRLCEACGKTGIEAMVYAAKRLKLHSLLLDYTTSAKASGDTRSVVGYMSTLFY